MTTPTSVVKTVGLTKVFRDFWMREKVAAVSLLDLDIYPNEVFGLLGPNGSGKSTTLKMILGLLFPTKGSISIFGASPKNVAVKNNMGFLPEESNLYPFLDARETLDFYGKLFDIPRKLRKNRIDMLLDMVGLNRVAYRRVGEYSKGMQRRIGLAQALINDPDLLILDEPTSGLDPIGTAQFKELIRTLAARGKTVILSSHLLSDCEDVCDRVAILYGGLKRAEGTVESLLANKNQTKLVTENLPADLIEKISKLIDDAGKSVISVESPKEKLESFFMQIVEEASQKNIKTGGATAGGAVAEFLRESTGEDLVENLVKQAVSESVKELTPEVIKTPAPKSSNEKVLSELISNPEEKKESANKQNEKAAEKLNVENADRSFIEGLIGDDKSSEDK